MTNNEHQDHMSSDDMPEEWGVPPVAPPLAPPRAAYVPPVAPPVAPPLAPPRAAYVPPVAPPVAPMYPPSVPAPFVSASQPLDEDVVARSVKAPVAAPSASTPGIQEIEGGGDDPNLIILDELLLYMVEMGGSDLHLSAGSPPVMRLRGDMTEIPGYGALTPTAIRTAMYGIINGKQAAVFEERLELDFAYTVFGQGRFRVNLLMQRGSVGAVMRTIPWEIKSLESLNVPEIVGTFADLPRGFVLVTGPTGSGKSTTLAAIIDKANRTHHGHIMTIEDPIEFLHQHRSSIVNQREVGEDTLSFKDALKHVLRQDPDIILVGELRDLETISVALTAAETGHLVFATLHTSSVQETITRIIDVFPPNQQQQVRTQLAASLRAVICQTLCKTADGNGRIAAVEIMVCNVGISAMIRDNKLAQIQGALQAGGAFGNQTLNQHLSVLFKTGKITAKTAKEKCSDIVDLVNLCGGEDGIATIERNFLRAKDTRRGSL